MFIRTFQKINSSRRNQSYLRHKFLHISYSQLGISWAASFKSVSVCIVIIAGTLFVSGQQGLVWLSVQSLSGKKFVAVRDKEMRSLLKDSAKEVMHQGKKVNTADYETTYGSVLFLVNWICPVQIKGAYPKREAKQNEETEKYIPNR